MHRFTRITAASVISLTCLASCSSDENGGDFLTWEQKNAEYKDAVADFPYPLPAGVSFPPESPGEQEGGSLYGKGLGEGDAWFFWECAHQRNFLESNEPNPQEATTSLDLLNKFTDTEWYKKHVEDPEKNYNKALTSARLGDTTRLLEYYNGCDKVLS